MSVMTALRKKIRIFAPSQQRGAALVIAVLILLILTVVGIYAVTTSTLETKIAGSERVLQEAFHAADGGVDYGRHVIELFLAEQNPTLPSGATVEPNATAFRQEILGEVTGGSPYVDAEIGKCDVEIHVDRIKAEEATGYSSEFGAPASEKQMTIYYLVDSKSTGQIGGASSQIETNYRRVVE
jgi:Tfp pilus assembly protein PilX